MLHMNLILGYLSSSSLVIYESLSGRWTSAQKTVDDIKLTIKKQLLC